MCGDEYKLPFKIAFFAYLLKKFHNERRNSIMRALALRAAKISIRCLKVSIPETDYIPRSFRNFLDFSSLLMWYWINVERMVSPSQRACFENFNR